MGRKTYPAGETPQIEVSISNSLIKSRISPLVSTPSPRGGKSGAPKTLIVSFENKYRRGQNNKARNLRRHLHSIFDLRIGIIRDIIVKMADKLIQIPGDYVILIE